MKAPNFVWSIVLLGALIALGSYGLFRIVRVDYGYHLKAEFKSMPSDDRQLRRWIGSQPGVDRVCTYRTNDTLMVFILMSRDLIGNPALPDLAKACETFGYAGRTGAFRDCPESEYHVPWEFDTNE